MLNDISMGIVNLGPQQFKRIIFRNTFVPMALAVVLSAIFSTLIMNLVAEMKTAEHSNLTISKAHYALQLVVDAETGLRGYELTGKRLYLAPYEESLKNLPGQLSELKEWVSNSPAQTRRVDQIDTERRGWLIFAQRTIDHRWSLLSSARTINTGEGKRLMDGIRVSFAELIQNEETLRSRRTLHTQETVQYALALTLLSSLLMGGLIAWYARKQLGSVANTYGNALEKQSQQNQELQEQAWYRTAGAELSDLLRGEHSLGEICSQIVSFVSRYLDAKVGALYVLESPQQMRLLAGYALSERDGGEAQSPPLLRVGESLAGQAIIERRSLAISPAPADYLKINSSLGSSSSAAVLISPLLAGGNIKGVMEYGFARALAPRDLELMQQLSESIALAITSAQYRTRLQELLEESQKQAEELQTQQEELRVNNEELEEQAKSLNESQHQLEHQQTELEATNEQLGGQARSLELKNDELGEIRVNLEKNARELERSSQYKSQFLANMSHELRTPLNSTLILSQLLSENAAGRLLPEEVEYARTIQSSSNDLLLLINDILDLAKVESGKIELHPEKTEIRSLLEGIIKTFAPMAKRKGIALVVEIRQEIEEEMMVDSLRLEQIFRNLVSNALKFTERGMVTVSASKTAANQISFEVSDTGIGIAKDKLETIFEAFQQADGSTSRQYGGTGLGLTISRDLAHLLGGEIQVESEIGKGSRFSLTLPITPMSPGSSPLLPRLPSVPEREPVANPVSQTSDASPLADDRQALDRSLRLLLVVEDDRAFSQILRRMSHERHFQCLLARTGEEAVSLAREYLPAAIILDMRLPDHSGLFVLDQLKETPATRHIPVHAVSAFDHTTAALQMGAIGYLRKPAKVEELTEVFRKLEDKITQKLKKVLVVEDNSTQRDCIKKLIGNEKVEVRAVGTGSEALKLLESGIFDCMIIDLSLPDMTGYELLERMSAASGIVTKPPVIVYTGRSLTREEEECLNHYSRSIILKGAKSPERLLGEVSLFLHQIESTLSIEHQQTIHELRDRENMLDSRTILVVDDDVRNVFALTCSLEARGARVEIARNGKEAVAKINDHPKIDLVLMDVMMPEMDGYEATREIRRDSRFKELPIIAVTAKAMPDDQEKCLEAGANDYLAKPINLPNLMTLIRVWMRPNATGQA
jgi:CheY-like chemotaxis protein/CHASE3 domain sensor protein